MHSSIIGAHDGQAAIAQTDPDDNPLEQGDEQPSAPIATDEAHSSFPSPNTPGQPGTWMLQPGDEPDMPSPLVGTGQWSSAWDGSKPLPIELPNGAQIRSLYFPIVPPNSIQIFAGATSSGLPIVPSLQPVGVLPIPPGHQTLTIVASAAFGGSLPIYATSDVLDPTPNESVGVSLATTPVTIIEPKASNLLAGKTVNVADDRWIYTIYTPTAPVAITRITWYYNAQGASGSALRIGVGANMVASSEGAVLTGSVEFSTPIALDAGASLLASGYGTWTGQTVTFNVWGYAIA